MHVHYRVGNDSDSYLQVVSVVCGVEGEARVDGANHGGDLLIGPTQ